MEDDFEHLFDEIKSCDFLRNSDVLPKIDSLLNNYRRNKVCILLIGETSAGKTTLVNTFLAYNAVTKSFNQDFINFLAVDGRENTTYIWVIEASQDQYFSLQINEEQPIRYNAELFKENLKEIKKKIKSLNEEQKEKVNEMKAQAEFDQKIIRILIPDFDPRVKILDVPGVSSSSTQKTLRNLFDIEMACILYIKELSPSEYIKESVIKFVADIQKDDDKRDQFSVPTFFSIVFTKKDMFFKLPDEDVEAHLHEANNDWEESIKLAMKKKVNDFKDIIDTTKKYICKEGIKIFGVHLLNLHILNLPYKKPNFDSESQCFDRLEQSLQVLKNYSLGMRPVKFLDSCLNFIDEDINKKGKEKLISEEQIDDISSLLDKEMENFVKLLNSFFMSFKDLTTLENQQSEIFDEMQALIKKLIEEDKRMANGWEIWNRNNFIERMISKIHEPILKLIIDAITEQFQGSLQKAMGKVKTIIGEQNFQQVFNIDLTSANSIGINFDEQDQKMIRLFVVGALSSFGLMGIQRSAVSLGLIVAGESLIPGIGWIAAGFTLAGAVYSLKNHIGLFDRENCAKDILKKMIQSLYERKAQIKQRNRENGKIVFENILDKLINAKIAAGEVRKMKEQIIKQKMKYAERVDFKNEINGGDRFIWKKIKCEELEIVPEFKKIFPKFREYLDKEAFKEI